MAARAAARLPLFVVGDVLLGDEADADAGTGDDPPAKLNRHPAHLDERQPRLPRGVYLSRSGKRYHARETWGRLRRLGTFATIEEAAAAVARAESEE